MFYALPDGFLMGEIYLMFKKSARFQGRTSQSFIDAAVGNDKMDML